MRAVVFETPGLLDLRSITRLGVNVKPNTQSPIGRFGTGLKYSVAVLVRMGLGLSLVTGGCVYGFYQKTERFREKSFDFIRMRREYLDPPLKRKYEELPYTTEFGRDWQLWQVFRELHSNTLDEGGETYVVAGVDQLDYQPDRTYIIVVGEAFVREYEQRHNTFLPDGLTQHSATAQLQVLDRPSQHVYYRGMRVYDLDKPAQFTYNFLKEVELTEDRTAKNSMALRTDIEAYMLRQADAEVVQRAVNAPAGTLEAELSYTNHYAEPSPAFVQAVQAGAQANPTAARYVQGRLARRQHGNPLASRPRPWRVVDGAIEDAQGTVLLRADPSGPLQPVQLSYVLALLNRDLYGWELDQWVAQQTGDVGTLDALAEVPF